MAYSVGGIISATDYNTRATDINNIWGVGSGSNGYGQGTTLSSVSASNTVSATNWASAIARVDSMRAHQSGVTSGITQPSAGNTIQYLSTLDTQISTIVTNKLAANTRGTASPTGLGSLANATAWSTSAVKEFYVSFSDVNTVRYYFNAGGLITSYATQTGGSTTKSSDWNTFLTNTVGTITIGSNFCSRSGSGGDNLTLNTGIGYHSLTTTYQLLFNIGSTSATADYGLSSVQVYAKVGGSLYGAGCNQVYIYWAFADTATDLFNDTVNGTTTVNIGYTPPETTYISNTWGTLASVGVTNTQG
jgi:hypothetical protein